MSVFIILIFLLIFFIYILQKKEKFVNYNCPTSMIRLSGKILAYYKIDDTSKKKNMIGINPIVFNSINEYKKYVNYQNEKGMNCPILNINHKNDVYPIENAVRDQVISIPSDIKKVFISKLKEQY